MLLKHWHGPFKLTFNHNARKWTTKKKSVSFIKRIKNEEKRVMEILFLFIFWRINTQLYMAQRIITNEKKCLMHNLKALQFLKNQKLKWLITVWILYNCRKKVYLKKSMTANFFPLSVSPVLSFLMWPPQRINGNCYFGTIIKHSSHSQCLSLSLYPFKPLSFCNFM